MRLKKILEGIPYTSQNLLDVEIRGIDYNSKRILSDYLFIAMQGSVVDGHDFIKDAISRGAIAVIGEKDYELKDLPYIKVENLRQHLPTIARNFYGDLSERMTVIGVTGTNGKTTVTYFVESILHEAREKCLVIGTVNYRFAGVEYPAVNTTPSVLDVYKFMAKALKHGVKYCVMEVSSHSLELGRVAGIKFDVAAFTNLSQEHLDFHKDMENYARAKQKLFVGLMPQAWAIVNADDRYGEFMVSQSRANRLKYGLKSDDIDITAELKNISLKGTDLNIAYENMKYPAHINLIGIHNVYNALCAFGIGAALGYSAEKIIRGLSALKVVPGRLEPVITGREFSIFVDYAHTPDALEKVIASLKQLAPGRVIVVFGAGGDRDASKRPKMGKVVTELADYAIVTSDNPRTEDPQKIIEDILAGIDKENYEVEPDRELAIKRAIEIARVGDAILVAGKGHEQYQIVGQEKRPYSDFEAIRRALSRW